MYYEIIVYIFTQSNTNGKILYQTPHKAIKINKNYGHYQFFFSTSPKSATSKKDAEKLFKFFKQVFPSPTFKIIVQKWKNETSEIVEF